MRKREQRLLAPFRSSASGLSAPPPPMLWPSRIPRGIGCPRLPGVRAPNRKRWLTRAGATSAAVAVLAGTLAAGWGAPASKRATTALTQAELGIPRYYVELDIRGPITTYGDPVAAAVVRVTATGAAIARISAPRPYKGFTVVTGAGDDRTFVLLANAPTDPFTNATPERFFLLHIDPNASSAAARARLTPLPTDDILGGQIPGSGVGTMALSPDGNSLAAILTVGGKVYLDIYQLATRKTRIVVSKPCSGCMPYSLGGASTLSWTSDSRSLAFMSEPAPAAPTQLRLLQIGGGSDNVQAGSTPFVIHAPENYWRQAVMTPDGETVFLKLTLPGPNLDVLGSYTLMRFSVATGRLLTINTLPMINTAGYASSGPFTADTILWTNDNGSKIIIADARPGHTLGVYSGRAYTALPWPAHAVGAAW